MGMHYRSESSSSLTNEQIDENFRILSGNKSVTGSVTLSGSLIPSDPEFSLGSNEAPFESIYLNNSVTFISGNTSQSAVYLHEPRTYTPEFETYTPDNPTGPNLNQDYLIYKTVKGSDLGLEDFSKTSIDAFAIQPPSGSLSGSIFPQGINTLGNWWNQSSILDNGGGFGIVHSRVLVGANWLDRSRHYATDGIFLSGSNQYNDSIGWWQDNHEPKGAITGKASVIWDNTRPRLWQFSAEGGLGSGNAYVTYAQTNGEPFAYSAFANQWGTEKNKSYYYNLLVSGSAYNVDLVTGLPTTTSLEPPPYDDGDILVRMWNDNLPYWSYWSKLEYDEENIIYYNISSSTDPLGGPNPVYYQDSINPGRIKLINNYSGSTTKWSLGSNSRTYQYGYDYNPSDPFISSSNLCLSLRMMAGPFVHNPTDSFYLGQPPTHVQNSGYNLGDIFPVGYSVNGAGRIKLPNTKQYGQVIQPPMPNAWANAYFYLNTSSLAPDTNENVGLAGVYPTGAYSSQMIWDQLDLSGSSQTSGYQSVALGYHYLTLSNPVGDCGSDPAYGATFTEILPIIPLTTAHYPLSASHFWITASYSNDILTFRKPNDRVGSPSLYTLPFVITASGSTSTIYNSDSVLPDNRIVDLNGYDLTFNASSGEIFTIDSNPLSKVAITNLPNSSSSTLIGYDTSDGTLSTTNLTDTRPYFYSTGSTSNNSDVNPNRKLLLGEVYNYNSPDYLLFDNSVYTVKTAGKYYININGTLGQDDQMLSAGLGWWKISLQINGTTVAESTAKQSGVAEYYGGLDLMYVGDLSVEDEIQIISNTSNPTATSTISNTTYRFSAEYLGS